MKNRQERINQIYQFLTKSQVAFDWRDLKDNTATAVLAAAALSCPVACIAKSIVFHHHNTAIVAVLCGNNRVNINQLSNITHHPLEKANAHFVREKCGFEIGGVSPIIHNNTAMVILENKLRQYPIVWASAGSAYTVFGINPNDLATITQANFGDFAE